MSSIFTSFIFLILNSLCVTNIKSSFFLLSINQEKHLNITMTGSYFFLFQNIIIAFLFLSSYQNMEKRLNEMMTRLVKINVELELALKSKDLFIASLSHEVRNPLNSILGCIQLLLSQITDSNLKLLLNIAKLCGKILTR